MRNERYRRKGCGADMKEVRLPKRAGRSLLKEYRRRYQLILMLLLLLILLLLLVLVLIVVHCHEMARYCHTQ